MKVVEAKYTRRFTTGIDYEFKEMTLTAQVDDGETGTEALTQLEAEVVAAHTGETETKPAGKKAKPAKKGKVNARSTDDSDDENSDDEDPGSEDAGGDDEGAEDNEAADVEASDDSDDSSEDGEEGDDGEEDSKPAKGKGKTTKAAADKGGSKKTFKKKPQSYDRTKEPHKEIFSGILRAVAPDWKKNQASKDKAKKVSEKMNGKAFLDEDGEVLPEFKAEVKKLMAAKK